MGVDVHVVPRGDGWAVKCEGHAHSKDRHATQEAAIDVARELAIEEHSELVVHAADGTIRAKWSYGSDPSDIPG